ncbi:hypothetical protein [Caulobacter sp. FWC2]|uniref:hypothetical protein n=1 Tax=Caulobacter sp. FWC2 TaxID=69664 RepID=UPI000C1460D6|nr:hypothetical protein [Caulobacter sp. FWC2]PIB91376.1 hypothetical protein CSW62_07150 [Caulobacter sp. FWC2]
MKRVLMAGLAAACLATSAFGQPIDRHALVSRHDVRLTAVDPSSPLMVGNGQIGFTADITGLQTFPEAYSKIAPLLTEAQWAWHAFPNPNHYTYADGTVPIDVRGSKQPYAYMADWNEGEKRPALLWLRENPHRFSLGRVALDLRDKAGKPARFEDLKQTEQTLDLWTGILTSRFTYDGETVTVRTRVHPTLDMIVVDVDSALVEQGRLKLSVKFPGVSKTLNPDPSDWDHPELHTTKVTGEGATRLDVSRQLDETRYVAALQADRAVDFTAAGPHAFVVAPKAKGRALGLEVAFSRAPLPKQLPTVTLADQATRAHWKRYWTQGAAVDFSGSTDPRAAELERRVVLSQYLMALNGAGEVPPQEEGLFSNSWNGKFHLEMHAWHAGHFALWNKPEYLERSLPWYVSHLKDAKARAASHGVKGAWWPKMVGPDGVDSPSKVSPFIMWQQPHPIWMSELIWRDKPTKATLAKYGQLVSETADLLASFPHKDDRGRFILGPPIIPVQENYDPLTTFNPAFELEYYRWGLEKAQQWRTRAGLKRKPEWDAVIKGLAPLATKDGLYLPAESGPDFWKVAKSAACSKHAVDPKCMNRDHPSFLMAYGLIPGKADPETMRRTLRAVETDWDLRQTWGWDYPMVAMTAARLGEPDKAVDWLFYEAKNNKFGVSGMTPRVHQDEHAQAFVPSTVVSGGQIVPAGEAVGPDGPGYRRAAETYFPSNGSLLAAVAMMAGGWDGSKGPTPGFPKDGKWTVKAEGFKPLP